MAWGSSATPGRKAGRRWRRARARKPWSSMAKGLRACLSSTCSTSAVTGVTCNRDRGGLIYTPSGNSPLALPDFLQAKVPLVKIGKLKRGNVEFVEPRYDHPAFQSAFRELNELLAAEFDANLLTEYADLMMYGFWGEGHTSDLPSPFPDYLTAEKTFVEMTELQLNLWKKAQLAVNTQPDISRVGNNRVLDMCVRAGCWLRSDSIVIEEPMQIEELANRPPWLATIMEDGYYRQYKVDPNYLPVDEAGINVLEKWMLHAIDLGANYWSLWTESDNLRRYYQH